MPPVRFMLASVTLALAVGFATDVARSSSDSCLVASSANRAPAVAGRAIRPVYAIASDSPDRSAAWAPLISEDVKEISAWWRSQDAEREPRFDVVSTSCGREPDIGILRLPDTEASLEPQAGRADRITNALLASTDGSPFEKFLVYYDGPVAPAAVPMCGQGGGEPDGIATAIVFVAACPAVQTEVVAVHELLHALGGAPRQGPPNACPGSTLHVCDSPLDVLSPVASRAALSTLTLDAGRDDYYGHAGRWPDLQDSRWLTRVDRQVSLVLALEGAGRVQSNIPGVNCRGPCVSRWDQGTFVSLRAVAAPGARFVGWTGACTGTRRCDLTLKRSANVRAHFALRTSSSLRRASGR
jgi:hypothetical protein